MFQDTYRFFLTGQFNQQQVNLYAGDDDIVLNTFYSEENDLVKMQGQLTHSSNAEANTFELIFTGARNIATSSFEANSVMQLGSFSLADKSGYTRVPNTYFVQCAVSNPLPGFQYNWKRNGVSLGNATAYSYSFAEEDLENARFTLETTNSIGTCNSSVYHEIKGPYDSAWADISASVDSVLHLAVSSNYPSPISKVSWYTDGSITASTQALSLSNTTSATYEAHVTFEDGATHVTGITVNLASISFLCHHNFSMEISPNVVYNSENVNTVEVAYYDPSGKRYSSYYENNVGEFALENVSAFDKNENNQPTIRFSFWGDMILKADDGSEMDCSFTGNMAVAHPVQ